MRVLSSSISFMAVLAITLLNGCATQTPYDYTAFKQSRPRSILILPPVNDSPAVEASYTVLSTMSMPLGESGYYVIPVALAAETFRQNGLSNPADIESVSISKLRQIFGADAALYTHVKSYGTSYKVVTSDSVVTVEGRLVDLRSGLEIWKGAASASSAENHGNSGGGGIVGLLVLAVVNQVMESTTDMSHKMAPVTSARLLTAGMPRGVLYGPRSPKYDGTDPAIVASTVPATANATLEPAGAAMPAAVALAPVSTAIPTPAVVTPVPALASAAMLADSSAACAKMAAPGVNCIIGLDAAGNGQLRIQMRDSTVIATQKVQASTLSKLYCSEVARNNMTGSVSLEDQKRAMESDFTCGDGASWSTWKPVAKTGV